MDEKTGKRETEDSKYGEYRKKPAKIEKGLTGEGGDDKNKGKKEKKMRKLRRTYRSKMGELRVERGKEGERRLFAWDAVQKCVPGGCRIAEVCEWRFEGGICKVHLNYLKAVSDVILRNFGKQLDEAKMWRVGMHLVPLYSMLCRMLMFEVGVRQVGEYDKNDRMVMSPIYKEIRTTVTLVEKLWKELELDKLISEVGLEEKDLKNLVRGQLNEEGANLNYYEQMEKGEIG